MHEHIAVNRQAMDAFLAEDDDVRLLILAELRFRCVDQETSLVLTP